MIEIDSLDNYNRTYKFAESVGIVLLHSGKTPFLISQELFRIFLKHVLISSTQWYMQCHLRQPLILYHAMWTANCLSLCLVFDVQQSVALSKHAFALSRFFVLTDRNVSSFIFVLAQANEPFYCLAANASVDQR